MRLVRVWDGIRFTQMEENDADAMEKNGKCQVIRGAMAGAEYKHRREMKGYQDKELKPEHKASKPKKKAAKKKAKDKPETSPDVKTEDNDQGE